MEVSRPLHSPTALFVTKQLQVPFGQVSKRQLAFAVAVNESKPTCFCDNWSDTGLAIHLALRSVEKNTFPAALHTQTFCIYHQHSISFKMAASLNKIINFLSRPVCSHFTSMAATQLSSQYLLLWPRQDRITSFKQGTTSGVKISEVMWRVVMWSELTWFLCKWFCFEEKWSELKWVTVKFLGTKLPCTLGWPYTEGTWLYCDHFMWFVCILCCGCFNLYCDVWVCVCVGFVICGCFGNICTCIYCVLYCLCCVLYCFVYVYLFLLVLSVLV